jgi:uncharacterized integral membrane protein
VTATAVSAAGQEVSMTRWRLILALVLIILVVIVVIQNTETVDTRLLFFTISMPRALLLCVTFLLGTVSGILLAIWHSARKRKAVS